MKGIRFFWKNQNQKNWQNCNLWILYHYLKQNQVNSLYHLKVAGRCHLFPPKRQKASGAAIFPPIQWSDLGSWSLTIRLLLLRHQLSAARLIPSNRNRWHKPGKIQSWWIPDYAGWTPLHFWNCGWFQKLFQTHRQPVVLDTAPEQCAGRGSFPVLYDGF